MENFSKNKNKMTPQQVENIKIGSAVVATGLILYLIFGSKSKNGVVDPEVTGDPAIPFDARNVAEGLYDAMNRFGTDDNSILELLKPVSPGQFMLVSRAFGMKPYNALLGNDYGFFLDKYPLKTWLKKELPASDYAILKNKYLNQL